MSHISMSHISMSHISMSHISVSHVARVGSSVSWHWILYVVKSGDDLAGKTDAGGDHNEPGLERGAAQTLARQTYDRHNDGAPIRYWLFVLRFACGGVDEAHARDEAPPDSEHGKKSAW